MAKWCVQIMFTGCAYVEVDADSYEEACEEAIDMADVNMVDSWDTDIDECWYGEDD